MLVDSAVFATTFAFDKEGVSKVRSNGWGGWEVKARQEGVEDVVILFVVRIVNEIDEICVIYVFAESLFDV